MWFTAVMDLLLHLWLSGCVWEVGHLVPRCSTKSFKLDTEHAHTLGVLVETAVWFSVILGGEQKRERACHLSGKPEAEGEKKKAGLSGRLLGELMSCFVLLLPSLARLCVSFLGSAACFVLS